MKESKPDLSAKEIDAMVNNETITEDAEAEADDTSDEAANQTPAPVEINGKRGKIIQFFVPEW